MKRSKKGTELKAIKLMRKFFKKKVYCGDVSQKLIGMDLILIPKKENKKVLEGLVELKRNINKILPYLEEKTNNGFIMIYILD